MSLRDVFLGVVRSKLYTMLKSSYMRDWTAELVYSLIDEAMNEKSYDIQVYLQEHVVTLENMNNAAQWVAQNIILPSITQRRVQ